MLQTIIKKLDIVVYCLSINYLYNLFNHYLTNKHLTEGTIMKRDSNGNIKLWICPKCHQETTDFSALSREDNKTKYILSVV